MSEDQALHKYLLKKLGREVGKANVVLHLSNEQDEISTLISEKNTYVKVSQLADLSLQNFEFKKNMFGCVIADMEMPDLDDFDAFIDYAKSKLLIPGGMLVIIATNLASFENIVALIFNNDLPNFKRPSRAVSPGFLRERLLKEGFALQNRFWIYDHKMMVIANLK